LALVLAENAEAYARVALRNIEREFPHAGGLYESEPRPVRRPRERHPAFYGSLDWHSCVEMFWVLARVLRLSRSAVPEGEIRAALEEHLTAERLSAGPRPVKWCATVSAPSSLDIYAAASIAITSSGSSMGSESAFVIDSALM
jgi:hypothetical protein